MTVSPAAVPPATVPPAAVLRATAAMDADVLIIGSGAGGATTAAVLAEAGLDVLVVEEGEWVEQGALVPFSLEQMDRQYRAGGVTVALGLPSIAYTEGRCAGGGTEVNSGLYWRPPGDVLQRWREQFRIVDFDPDELLAIADEVERDISVCPAPGGYTEPSEVLRRGADALGWRNGEIPRWMTYPTATSRTGQRQSMTRTYLPRAMRAGARMAVECRVDRLRAARAAVVGRHHARRRHPGTITFRHVFVCGGAIQSPALLQRSGIRGHIGRTLAVHPTVKLAARFPDALNVPDDVPVHQVKEFAPAPVVRGFRQQPWPGGAVVARPVGHVPAGRHSVAAHQRVLRRHHQRGTRQGAFVPPDEGPRRHLRPHLARSRTAAQRARPPGLADAGGRCRRGLPVVQRRPVGAQPARPGHHADRRSPPPGPAS
jgi:glycine/D-amino acid oxidase-like deaminating enzyme